MKKTKVIIADDHPVVIQGISKLYSDTSDFDIIGQFSNGSSLLQSPLLSQSQLLLIDLNMTQTDGLEAIGRIRNNYPTLKIVILTSYHSPQLVEQCKSMAQGYLVKSEDLRTMVERVRLILNGATVFPDFEKNEYQSDDTFSYFDDFMKKYNLTKREVEIIKMICADKTTNEIAEKLHISAFTVQTHRRNFLKKLHLDGSNITLYKFANENGLLP